MSLTIQRTHTLVAMVIAIGMLVGCANGFDGTQADATNTSTQKQTSAPAPEDSVGSVPQKVEIDLEKIKKDARVMEERLGASSDSLKNVFDSNNRFSSSQKKEGEVQGQIIAEPIAHILDRATFVVNRVADAFNLVRSTLAAHIAKLDPANPAHASLLSNLMKVSETLDKIQARLGQVIDTVFSKIYYVMDKIEDFLENLNPIFQFLLVSEVKTLRAAIERLETALNRIG